MQRRPGTAAAVGLAGIVLIVADWALAFHSGRGMWLDRNVLDGFYSLHDTRIGGIADALPHLSDPAPFLLWFLLIVGTALVRGRPRYALVTGVILFGSNLTTHLLKPALGGHDSNIAGLYGKLLWPSGHATASMAVALCAILVAPARWRPLVAACGAVYTLVVSFTLMISGWHFPSDVVAGYLMAGTWTAFGVAALWAAEQRSARGGRPADGPDLAPRRHRARAHRRPRRPRPVPARDLRPPRRGDRLRQRSHRLRRRRGPHRRARAVARRRSRGGDDQYA